ncbi:MAG: hypothetical protein KDJ29_21375 [Hyphomicrobiales bacterium]|nr:hypothetical protein [Hyphomicrobiales bacterium]
MEKTSAPTFVLGLGAQKAGTSWISGYLKTEKTAKMGQLKEYHVWDAKYADLGAPFKVAENSIGRDEKSILRYAMQNYDGFYEKYFASLIRQRSNISITGDITPTYGTLSEDNLREIKERLEHVGFRVKTVLLLRDPVQRCWSAVRMKLRNEGNTSPNEEETNSLLAKLYQTPEYALRTDYATMVGKVEKVFAPENTYYGFYENMFSEEKVRAIADYLSIPTRLEYSSVRKNTSPTVTISDANREALRSFYKSTYDFCFDRFPEGRELWEAA